MKYELCLLQQDLHSNLDVSGVTRIAEEAIAIAQELGEELNAKLLLLRNERDQHLREMEKLMRTLCDARIERAMLKNYLRQALRQWLLNTPDVEDAVTVWRVTREADLAQ